MEGTIMITARLLNDGRVSIQSPEMDLADMLHLASHVCVAVMRETGLTMRQINNEAERIKGNPLWTAPECAPSAN